MSTSRRYFKELRFRQLRALVMLVRKGSFSAVAGVFGIAVPSVWQQIRALEDEFGTALVMQTGKTAVLVLREGLMRVGEAQKRCRAFY